MAINYVSIDVGIFNFGYSYFSDGILISYGQINILKGIGNFDKYLARKQNKAKNTKKGKKPRKKPISNLHLINGFVMNFLPLISDTIINIDTILIERQMAINTDNFKFQSIIEAILLSRKSMYDYKYDIVIVNSPLKLKFICPNQSELSYSQKKKYAQKYCSSELKLEVSTDVADSILQYLAYIKQQD